MEVTQAWLKEFFTYLRDEAKSLGVEALGKPEEVADWEPYQDAFHSAHAIGMLIASAITQTRKTVASDKVDGTPLKELDLPEMYYLRLRRTGYETVEQVCKKTRRQLLLHWLIGPNCVKRVELALAERGLSLQEVPLRRSVAED